MFRNCFVVIFTLVIIESVFGSPIINSEQDCYMDSPEEVRIFITISSLYVSTTEDGIVKRQLEVNWVKDPVSGGDTIKVFRSDPTIHSSAHPLLSIDPSLYPGGYFRSDVELPVQFFNMSTLVEEPCRGYWAAYLNSKNEILSSSCLRIHPGWMEQNALTLESLRLKEVMIPGSHDSGSFYFRKETAPLSKYKYAQEESIFNQLVYGLRYFDLRVGYYKNTEDKFYINHNFLRTEHSVKSVLREVLRFIKATKEVVILDFHNFPIGFKNKFIHVRLMNLINRTFGRYLIPHNQHFKNATFSELWRSNKRVLVSYDSSFREFYFPKFLWPRIHRAWGNKQYPEDLKEYFEDVFQKPVPDGLWASMAELTPNTRTIVLHPETGLRMYADMVNRNVTHWFRDFYWHKANIVATDYFLGNNIIDVAIRTNKIKGLCPENSWSNLKP